MFTIPLGHVVLSAQSLSIPKLPFSENKTFSIVFILKKKKKKIDLV